jgi:hypothetical protein
MEMAYTLHAVHVGMNAHAHAHTACVSSPILVFKKRTDAVQVMRSRSKSATTKRAVVRAWKYEDFLAYCDRNGAGFMYITPEEDETTIMKRLAITMAMTEIEGP